MSLNPTSPSSVPAPSAPRTPPVPARGRGVTRMPRPPMPAEGRRNQEFLPAHLEILVTPASPYAGAFVWTISLMFAAALAWSCLARIDIFAVASGRVQPDGRSKIVQPFETSKVKAIHTANGTHVKAGDLLLELEPTAAAADVDASEAGLQSLDAQIARRKAVIAAVAGGRAGVDDPVFSAGAVPAAQVQELAAMHADLAKYIASRDSLMAQIDEKTATENRYVNSIAARKRLIEALRQRQTMRQTLVDQDSGTKAAVIDATQQVEQASADLAYDSGQLLEAGAAKRSLQRKIDELARQTLAEQTQALSEAIPKRATAEQNLVKAQYRLAQMQLASPIDGTVQQLAVTTVGQVVTAGQPLLVIVPSNATINVEALVASKDIGFVSDGQEAVVKIDAFPYVRYGTIEGTVNQVSRDAVDTHDLSGSTDTVSAAKNGGIGEVTGTPTTQNLVFPVAIKLKQTTIEADGSTVPLTPGMTASVEIRTGNRRVIDFLLAPVFETVTTAGHER